jgi:glutamate dehydrogenase
MTISSIKEIESKISRIIRKSSKKYQFTENFKRYFFKFYTKTTHSDILKKDDSYIIGLAKSSFDFFRNRENHNPKIRIYNTNPNKDSWSSNRTILELINNDQPFLVDSITAEINRLGFKVTQIINRVIRSRRNKKGELIDILPEDSNEGQLESIIHFQISKINNQAVIDNLACNIKRTLEITKFAVSEWPLILERLYSLRFDLKSLNVLNKKQNLDEPIEFLDWLENNNFIFLGFIEYSVAITKKMKTYSPVPSTKLGIFKVYNPDDLLEIDTRLINEESQIIEVVKSMNKSKVHRPTHLDIIRIKKLNKKGQAIGEYRFFGLFTSSVFYQNAGNIPIIRKKISNVIQKANFDPTGHNGKELVANLNAYPREELLQITENDLYEIVIRIVAISGRSTVRIFRRYDKFKRFLSLFCFIPRRNFNTEIREQIQILFENAACGKTAEHSVHVTESPMIRLNFIIHLDPNNIKKINYDILEKQIKELTTSWNDRFAQKLKQEYGEEEYETIFKSYHYSFPISYTEFFNAAEACADVNRFKKVLSENIPLFILEQTDNVEIFYLKIYNHKEQIELSTIMPMIENFGIEVIDEHTFQIKPNFGQIQETVWLHNFKVNIKEITTRDFQDFRAVFEVALSLCWSGKAENDRINELVTKSRIASDNITILRSYTKYIHQTDFAYKDNFIYEVLIKNYKIAGLLIDFFHSKFNPDTKLQTDIIKRHIDIQLGEVTSLPEDAILRKYIEVINATLRTNFFQSDKDGNKKQYISFKLKSQDIGDLPLPKPYVEIFVYSPNMEGVHLRGGKVARGGLRWSDRHEDFRIEIQGLVKAQMTKNSVIVPVGSKGGFVVKKDLQGLNRDEFMNEGIGAYKTFLRGLLDITDNVINGKIVKPKNVKCYDLDDPYLVVAADKGTATFSDIANGVSAEYNFWLGDAFASGGSQGYDHKKMGITAKGAWVSVVRHFSEMEKDIEKEEFTVVGIGDMSGDVFGNGLLRSNNSQLIAAFNHLHIFVDPKPNSKKSFQERLRLFNLPRSSWCDYNKKLISAGGGVYARSLKKIKISKQVKKIFKITEDELAPNALIKYIISADCDLLWNGGIGTYAKASKENNVEVGDRANDSVRVNANQLKCRIVGEGGNLGLTQKARIEYAENGGRINTDALDNSAGVDCSDHEVNIKIALKSAIDNDKITSNQRNQILEAMTEEVEELVLRDNFLQTQAISIAQYQGVSALEHQNRLMERLEKVSLLDRKVEFLPDQEEIHKKQTDSQSLTRPELCVLLAYSKIYLYNSLVNSDLPDSEYYYNDLIRYFPEKMSVKFEKEIANHPLKREIIATFTANSMINRLGITFFNRLAADTGMKKCDIARAYTITRDVFNLREVWQDIESLLGVVKHDIMMQMFREVANLVERSTAWFLRNMKQPLNVSKTVNEFTPFIKKISSNLENILSPSSMKVYNEKHKFYSSNNVPELLAKKIAAIDGLTSVCFIVQVAKGKRVSVELVAQIFYEIGVNMNLRYLRITAAGMNLDNYWEKLSINNFIDNLFDQQMHITNEVIKKAIAHKKIKTSREAINFWLKDNQKQVDRFNELINDIQTHEFPDFSMLSVAGHRIKEVLQ